MPLVKCEDCKLPMRVVTRRKVHRCAMCRERNRSVTDASARIERQFQLHLDRIRRSGMFALTAEDILARKKP